MLTARRLPRPVRLPVAVAVICTGLSVAACGASVNVHAGVLHSSSTTRTAPGYVSASAASRRLTAQAGQTHSAAAKLVAESRSAFAAHPTVAVALDEHYVAGPPSTSTQIYSPSGYVDRTDISNGDRADQELFSHAAYIKATPAWWTLNGTIGAAVAQLSNRWVAVLPTASQALVHLVNDRVALAQCLVGTFNGGTVTIAGHTTEGGMPATIIAERGPAPSQETARLIVQTAAPHRPLLETEHGPLTADPACDHSAALDRTFKVFSTHYAYDVGPPTAPTPALGEQRYKAIAANNGGVTGTTVSRSVAHRLSHTFQLTGRVVAAVPSKSADLGATDHQSWTIRSRCSAGGCRLSVVAPQQRAAIALRPTAQDGYLGHTTVGVSCPTAAHGQLRIPLNVSIVPDGSHTLNAYTTLATRGCGGALGQYVVYHGTG